jgi:hypothetical protein
METKSEDFKYPTIEERKTANAILPKFSSFKFEYQSGIALIFNRELSPKEIEKRANLFYWDICLGNKFGKLRETYIYLLTNYYRGFNEDCSKSSFSGDSINHFLFDYYSEIFYYYYFSSIDIILQIINLYYTIGISEMKIRLNDEFLKKIKDEDVKKLLNTFKENTKEASELRNSFTHRFTPNLPENRIYVTEEFDGRKLVGKGNISDSQKLTNNMKMILEELSSLTTKLKENFKATPC